jgi:hypothetical protein
MYVPVYKLSPTDDSGVVSRVRFFEHKRGCRPSQPAREEGLDCAEKVDYVDRRGAQTYRPRVEDFGMSKTKVDQKPTALEKIRMERAVERAILETHRRAAERVGTRAFLYGCVFGAMLGAGALLGVLTALGAVQ